jgi:site-specific DNA recombinase
MKSGRGALYVRVSTSEQTLGVSLVDQEIKGRDALSKIYNCDCIKVYSEAYSGENFYERRVLQELLVDVDEGRYDVVLFWDTFRLARDPDYQVLVRSRAARAGCQINFTSEPMEPGLWSNVIQYIKGTMGKEELRKFRERAEMGKRGKALYEGKVIGMGKPPYGYVFTYGTRRNKPQVIGLAVDPKDAALVRWIFEAVAKQKRSLQSICDDLIARKEAAPKGGKLWWPTTVRNIVLNEVYKGVLYQWKYATGKSKKGSAMPVLRDKSEWIAMPEGTVEPIVSPELWEAANKALLENKRLSHRNGRHPEAFLLRGYVTCGKCGSPMYTVYKTQHGPLYRCGAGNHPKGKRACVRPSPVRQAQPLDDAVWQAIYEYIVHFDNIREWIPSEQSERDDRSSGIEELNRRIRDREKERHNLATHLAHFSSDEPAAEALRNGLKQTETAIAKLRNAQNDLIQREHARRIAGTLCPTSFEQVMRLTHTLRNADFESKRLAVSALNVRVQLFNEDHATPYVVTGLESIPDTGNVAWREFRERIACAAFSDSGNGIEIGQGMSRAKSQDDPALIQQIELKRSIDWSRW